MSASKLLCFIVPYFGVLPNYFPVFLKSCKNNPQYEWLFFTDDRRAFDYPENVHVTYISFEQMKKRIESSFSFPIALPSPKKLCDFKPTYGYIFQEELKNYRYWGYCDIDIVLGDLSCFINELELKQNQKHFYLGHMSIYENSEEMRTIFMKGNGEKGDSSNKFGYLDVLTSNKNMVFDEWSESVETVNEIAEKMKIRINSSFPMLDIRPWRSRFYSTIFDPMVHTWLHNEKDNFIVSLEKEKLFSYARENGSIVKREILYAHFQKRKMRYKNVDLNADVVIFCPNKIVSCKNISNRTITTKLMVAKVRSWFFPDEISKKVHAFWKLWKHRYNKYIKPIFR